MSVLDWTLECGIRVSRLPKRFLIMDLLMFGISSICKYIIACPFNFTNVSWSSAGNIYTNISEPIILST